MDKNYHQEIDASPLLGPDDASKYRSILGALNWVVTLGRFDIQYATSAMSWFCFAPHKGHMLGAHCILRYLKTFPKGRIIADTNYFDHSAYQPQEHESWKQHYPGAHEEIPKDRLPSKGMKVCFMFFGMLALETVWSPGDQS